MYATLLSYTRHLFPANSSRVIVLARVREFLPQIERSNVELLQRDPRSIDIENIEETDEHVVEMASPRNTFIL